MEDFKQILILLEQLTEYLDKDTANYHLILLANSYIQLKDLLSCRRILSKIDPKYMNSKLIYKEIDTDKEFSDKLANIMEVFGIFLHKIIGSDLIIN